MTDATSPSPAHGGWRPLLGGAPAERALDAAHDVTLALRAIADDSAGLASGLDASLSGGMAGLATLFAYAHRTWPDEGYDRTARLCLDRASTLVATTRMRPALLGGFAGVAWVLTHLQAQLHPGRPDPVTSVDEALAGFVARSPWRADYDLVSGLVGYGVYALERLRTRTPAPAAATACLTSVVERLAELVERRGDGTATWHTAPELLPPHQRAECPAGYYNLGVAHGVPGVVAVLGGAWAAGVGRDRAGPPLRGAVSWLLAQRVSDGGVARFPSVVSPGAPPPSATRSAWCYGDPGVAAALLAAARATGEREWTDEALEIGVRSALRPPDESGVVDAGLCHGSAGLALIYNRLWQASGDERLREAAAWWVGRTLEYREPGRGVGGFRSYIADVAGSGEWADDPGLLTGAAGIALSLLAAATPVEPAWDRVLLVS